MISMRWDDLNDYLEFAKTQSQESTTKINLNDMLNSIKNKLNNDKISIKRNKETVELKARPTALKRSFENIIQNGLTYGNKVDVDIQKGNNEVLCNF